MFAPFAWTGSAIRNMNTPTFGGAGHSQNPSCEAHAHLEIAQVALHRVYSVHTVLLCQQKAELRVRNGIDVVWFSEIGNDDGMHSHLWVCMVMAIQ